MESIQRIMSPLPLKKAPLVKAERNLERVEKLIELFEQKIKDKIALAEIQFGKGQIILFAFRPQHRGQTWGTFPFIWNAINLAPR